MFVIGSPDAAPSGRRGPAGRARRGAARPRRGGRGCTARPAAPGGPAVRASAGRAGGGGAGRLVLRLGSAVPVGLARSLLDEAVQADARLRWKGALVALAGAAGEELTIENATFVVFDLETTGLRPGTARPCEIGAVRVRGLELEQRFATLTNPVARLQPAVAALTGIRDDQLRRAPPVAAGIRRFLSFAGDSVLVAHNARFDMA